MKAINFDKIHFQKLDNNKVKLSTNCQILDNFNKPVKNSLFIYSILNNESECSTDDNGYTKVTSIQNESTPLLSSSKEEIHALFKILFNTSLIIKKTTPKLLKLPIGDSSFENIITKNYLYIDKTSILKHMIEIGDKYCFLSRPRRFGKSITISTLEAIFRGKKNLFKGLQIEKEGYSFEEYPVIRIDFSSNQIIDGKTFNNVLLECIKRQGEIYSFSIKEKDPILFLEKLGYFLKKKFCKNIVILIDEYDKPLLDNIRKDKRNEIQENLKSFFTAIKSLTEINHFVFVTGVTNLSNMNMFSGANQFLDLSQLEEVSSLVGYTESELYKNFDSYIKVTAEKMKLDIETLKVKIRDYYNGYKFSEEGESIYNPFSLLTFFRNKKFNNYWYKSGTPTFLLEILKNKPLNFATEGGIESGNEIFSFSKLEDLNPKALMFQAGYLVIKEKVHEKKYILDFPNTEVRSSFFDTLFDTFTQDSSFRIDFVENIQKSLLEKNMPLLKSTFNKYIKKVPYTIHAKKDEPYYQTILHCLIVCSSYYPNAEMATNDGRSDHIISTKDRHYCIEYKMASKNECPIKQIKEKKYYRAIQPTDKAISLIGIIFDNSGNIVEDIMIEELKEF